MYKRLFEGKKAVLFDLEETVVKGLGIVKIQAFQFVMDSIYLGYIDPTPYCSAGYTFEETWEAIFHANEIKKSDLKIKTKDLVAKTTEMYLEIIKEEDFIIEPIEGFWSLFYELKEEKGFKTGLTTNLPRAIEEQLCEKLEIDGIFDTVVCVDDVREPKPSPKMYKRALKNLKVRPKETISFESSVPGVGAANKAKVDVCVIWNTYARKSLFGDSVKEFTIDFTPYPENLDETHEEYIARSVRGAVEDKRAGTANPQPLSL